MSEIWKIHPMYPHYSVSNLGRVRSLHHGCGRLLKPSRRGRVTLSEAGQAFYRPVAQLVAEAFHGIRRDGSEVIPRPVADHTKRLRNRFAENSGPRKKLPDECVLAIYQDKSTPIEDLASRYGVTKVSIYRIKNGTNWSWLTKHCK